MIYMKLETPVDTYDKIKVREFHSFDAVRDDEVSGMSFSYQYFKVVDGVTYVDTRQFKNIPPTEMVNIKAAKNTNPLLSSFDHICSLLLLYLHDNDIVRGSIERTS